MISEITDKTSEAEDYEYWKNTFGLSGRAAGCLVGLTPAKLNAMEPHELNFINGAGKVTINEILRKAWRQNPPSNIKPTREVLIVARTICEHQIGGFCLNVGGFYPLKCKVGRGIEPGLGENCKASDDQLSLSGNVDTARAAINAWNKACRNDV